LQMDQSLFFARIFGMTKQTLVTQAIAVHRPRDISIVLDFSGSMTFGSRNSLRRTGPDPDDNDYGNGNNRFSQNADPNFPRFGPWSIFPKDDPGSPSASTTPISPMQSLKFTPDSAGYSYGPANITYASASGPPIVLDFVVKQGAAGSETFTTKAWGSDAASYPAGRETPTIASYNLTTSATRPTVMPAPAEIANQNVAGWDVAKFGDKFPMKVMTPTAAPAGLDANPDDFAENAREYVNFIINNRVALTAASDPRVFPMDASTATPGTLNHWFDGSNAFDGTAPRTDFTGSPERNRRHRGFEAHGYGANFQGFTMGPGPVRRWTGASVSSTIATTATSMSASGTPAATASRSRPATSITTPSWPGSSPVRRCSRTACVAGASFITTPSPTRFPARPLPVNSGSGKNTSTT
jgi:hypothetical protein